MLTLATGITCSLLLVLTVMQSVYVYRYQRGLEESYDSADFQNRQEPQAGLMSSGRPSAVDGKAAIVLCLRGTDPALSDCLTGILSQDYPKFELHIVFDDGDDPAVAFVEQYFYGKGIQPYLHFNRDPLPTCSLKCSSLITVVKALPADVQYVALIDADTVADEHWLNDLLTPFADPEVGATTGNRWFTPHQEDLGSVYRKAWNAAAVPQIALYNIGWGGSLAFRRSVVSSCDLLAKWGTAFCEDTMVADALKPSGKRLQRVAHLIMDNDETTRLSDAFRWIVRQTLTVRLHHEIWPLVLGHGLLTGLVCYGTPVLILITLLTGDFGNSGALTRFFLIYQVFNVGLVWLIVRCNQKIIDSRAGFDPTSDDSPQSMWKLLLGVLLNQYSYPLAVWKAWTTKSVSWRGVDYAIGSDRSIRMKEYRPYRQVIGNAALPEKASIQ